MGRVNQELRFSGGMNMDLNPENSKGTTYRNARNVELLGDNAEDFLSLTNSLGNKSIISIPTIPHRNQWGIMPAIKIIGYKIVRDKVVIFTTANQDDGRDYNDQIWVVDYDPVSEVGSFILPTSATSLGSLKYSGKLNLSLRHKISSIEIDYRDEETMFVYFADGKNELRGVNVLDPDFINQPAASFGIVTDAKLKEVIIDGVGGGGELQAGMVQYTYRLTKGASVTNFAPVGNGVVIYKDNWVGGPGSVSITGSTVSEVTSKSCKISITLDSLSFDDIEIYRIFYSYFNGEPIVSKIYEGEVNDLEITHVDDGITNIGTITNLEATTIIYPQTPKWLTVADNRLFMANVKTSSFDVDFDARAYRFKWNNSSLLPMTIGSKYFINESDTTPSDVWSSSGGFISTEGIDLLKYQEDVYRYMKKEDAFSGTLTLGGSGINIDYRFVINYEAADSEPTNAFRSYTWNSVDTPAPKNPNTVLSKVGFRRDEIYRFGIVFYNASGAPSFVKWIGDIKMPTVAEFPITNNATIHGNLKGGEQHMLGVKFDVRNIPVDQDSGLPLTYRIVYVERTELDKRIIDQGLILPRAGDAFSSVVSGLEDTPAPIMSSKAYKKQFFFSPSVSYFRSSDRFDYSSYQMKEVQLRIISDEAYASAHDGTPSCGGAGWSQGAGNTYIGWSSYRTGKVYTSGYPTAPYKLNIESADFLESGESYAGFETKYNFNPSAKNILPRKYATSTAIQLDETQTELNNKLANKGNIVNIINEDKIQYGGYTDSARSRNTYIPATDIINPIATTSSVETNNGDTFITHWQWLSAMSNAEGTVDVGSDGWSKRSNSARFREQYVIPLESSFRTELNATPRPFDMPWNEGLYMEKHGIYTFLGAECPDKSLTQSFDAYVINTAYSRYNNQNKFFAKPYGFKESVTDNIIKYSDKNSPYGRKSVWSSFKANNYQTVDKNAGELNSIFNWNGDLLFMQPSGFGICNINERITTNGNNGLVTVLGTGDVLGKPIYVSNAIGTIHPESVVMAASSVHFYDRNENSIMSYVKAYKGNSTINVSKTKGINSFLKDNMSSYVNNTNSLLYHIDRQPPSPRKKPNPRLHIGVNAINVGGKLIFSFYDTRNIGDMYYSTSQFADTVGLNLSLNSFESFYDYNSPIYRAFNGKLSMLNPYTLNSIWLISDKGTERGKYFGEYYGTVIDLVTNGSNPLSKIFTNFQYTLDVTSPDGSDNRLETFDTVEVSNSYQSTGVVPIRSKKNAKRRFRKWNVTIPRAIKTSSNARKDVRIRDKYINSKFSFINNNNKKFELRDFKTSYVINNDEFINLNNK